MNRVVHFEIHASDPQRAMAFYEKLFGWKFQAYGQPDFYWLITTGQSGSENTGINGGLVKRMGATPKPGDPTPVVAYVCTIDVEDIDKTGAAIMAAGGALAHEKSAIPGLAWLAYYKDPDSNIFGVYKTDPKAK